MKVAHLALYSTREGVLTGRKQLFFLCPGCEESLHAPTVALPVEDDGGGKALWTWNGSEESPTIEPSLLVTYTFGEDRQKKTCHSYVREGQIQFLGDCTHSLAGQTVPLPPWPDGHLGIGVEDAD